MLKENLKDAAEILLNILSQPLAIEGRDEEISLLSAAKEFSSGNAESSALSDVMQNFGRYPEPTQTLIRELEILLEDIQVK